MTFRDFRDKAQWLALASGLVIVAGQWVLDVRYVDHQVWVDRTPASLILIGYVLTLLTLVFGLLTLPRWQSFPALAAVLWVVFISIQGI
jgi:hypothetical protein